MGKSSLPPGFRFHPTDVELVMYYLKRKILGKKLCVEAISEVNIYNFSPWDLPDKSCLRSKDREWFFFCPIERKYPNGARAKRATETGYWKATGKDRAVLYNENIVGRVRTLVFYTGHPPKGNRTDWVMHEYRMEDKEMTDAEIQDVYVLCKVFEKSGPGPKNGAQYGAPFNEEDWDEEDEVTTHGESFPVDELAPPVSYLTSSMIVPGHASSISSLSEPVHLALSIAEPSVINEGDVDDIALLLDIITEGGTSLPTLLNQNSENLSHNSSGKMEGDYDIFEGLGNLSEGGGGYNKLFPCIDESFFLELDDLNTPLEHNPIEDEVAATGSQLLLSTNDASTLSYNCYDVNFSDFVQNLSGYNNQSLDPPQSSNYPGNHFHVLQKEGHR